MKFKSGIVLLPILLGSLAIFGQSGHYWTQQYGTRSMLLSGSVVGGVEDLGAVYYNPARLAMVDNPAFLLSADVYELTKIKAEDAFGNNKNTSSSDFDGVPSLAAGTFRLKGLPAHHFAYAVLSRNHSNLRLGFRDEVYDEVFPDSPGDEYFGANVGLVLGINTQWFGASWSHRLSETLSIGASGFLSVEKQERDNSIDLNALTATNDVAIYHFNRNFQFNKYSVLAKLGLSYQLDKVLLGFTLTTPQLNLFGTGKYRYEQFITGLYPITGVGNRYTTSYQKDLEVKTKTPISIGAGITVPFLKGKLHLSSEWFGGIGQYQLLQTEQYSSQSDPDSLYQFTLVDQLKSVVNIGLGWEVYVSPHLSGFLSASTDFSAVSDNVSVFLDNRDITSNSTFRPDFYHFGGGFVLSVKGADITLGATYASASQKFSRPVDFPDGDGEDVIGGDETSNLSISRWRFVFSFSVPFLRDYARSLEEKIKSKKDEQQ